MPSIRNIFAHLMTVLYYGFTLKSIGAKSLIIKPLKIDNPRNIEIGSKVFIGHYSWLMGGMDSKVSLHIDDYVQIGHFAHIIAIQQVIIEKSVLCADKVFISDCTHNYQNVKIPVLEQGVSFINPVVIGEGSWIGENVCVCGASIGKHCIVGANSVVLNDVPDYSIVVGSPARVVKRYDFKRGEWTRISE